MNNHVNMREKSRDDSLKMKRDVVGNMPYRSPEIETMGRLAGHDRSLPNNVHTERNDFDIQGQLSKNPYVVDYKNAL